MQKVVNEPACNFSAPKRTEIHCSCWAKAKRHCKPWRTHRGDYRVLVIQKCKMLTLQQNFYLFLFEWPWTRTMLSKWPNFVFLWMHYSILRRPTYCTDCAAYSFYASDKFEGNWCNTFIFSLCTLSHFVVSVIFQEIKP